MRSPPGLLERMWIERLADQPDVCASRVMRLRANPLNLLNPACVFDIPDFYTHFGADLSRLARESLTRVDRSSCGPRVRWLSDSSRGSIWKPWSRVPRCGWCWARLSISKPSAIRRERSASPPRTGAQASCASSRNDEMTPDGKALDVLLASTAIPGVFASGEVDDDPYVDLAP